MPPKLTEESNIQILASTFNSMVYAVDTGSDTGFSKDTTTVLKGPELWYKRGDAVFLKTVSRNPENGRRNARQGRDDVRVARTASLPGHLPRARDERREGLGPSSPARETREKIRQYIVGTAGSPADMPTRIEMAAQLTEGLAYLHSRSVIWSDLFTRNALVGLTEDGARYQAL